MLRRNERRFLAHFGRSKSDWEDWGRWTIAPSNLRALREGRHALGWRSTLFWAAAVFNFAAGLPFLFAPEMMLHALQASVPQDPTFHRMCGLLVVCFGVIYAMIAKDLERYRQLVWVAVVGKVGVVAIFLIALTQGLAPPRAVGLAMGDLAFALAFLIFLLTPSKTQVARA